MRWLRRLIACIRLTKHYVSVEQEKLREHVKARLHVFNDEELDVKLVIFDEVPLHVPYGPAHVSHDWCHLASLGAGAHSAH